MLPTTTHYAEHDRSDARAESPLEVIVLHTNTKGTLQALKAAARLAKGLGAEIRLLVLESVPYPLPVEAPPVALEFTRRHFRTIAADARIETHIDIRLGRDEEQMLEDALKPRSVIVMGVKNGWWPTREKRTANRLKRRGHHVVLAKLEETEAAPARHGAPLEQRPVSLRSV